VKDVVVRVQLNRTRPLLTSADRKPELVIDGVVTELENVRDITVHYGTVDVSTVTITLIARLEVLE
jgi:hypothetical protein